MNDDTDMGFGTGYNVDDEPLAIMGNSSKASTMADGSLRLQIDVRPENAQAAFRLFGTPGSAVAMARLTDAVAVEEERPGKPKKGPYGEYAKALVQSGFFRTPKIWEAIGTDKLFLVWIRQQKSAYSKEYSEWHDDIGFCVPAHVRHLEHGSGTAIKPPYAAIPLTKAEHDLAHQKGDIALGDREWWDKQRIKYVSQWAFEQLKLNMQEESYTDISPQRLLCWATANDVADQLPARYHTLEDPDAETETKTSKAAGET